MIDRLRQMRADNRLTDFAQWTVFAIGIVSLVVSIGASAANAF